MNQNQPIAPKTPPATGVSPETSTDPAKSQTPPGEPSNRFTYLLKIKLGELEFSNLKGDILGAPFILLSTRQHSQIDFIANDQSSELWSKVLKQQGAQVSVELGFPPNTETVLSGKAYRLGRKFPDGITIEVVDAGFSLSGSTVSQAQSSTEAIASPTLKAALSEIDQKNNLKLNQTALALQTMFGAPSAPVSETPQKTPQQTVTQTGIDKLKEAAISGTNNKQPSPQLEKTAVASGLNFDNKSAAATGQQGNVAVSTPAMKSATDDAAKKGEVIIQDGNTVKQVGAGQGEPSGITLDYAKNKDCLIKCHISKKTPVQLQSGYGAVSVTGWSVNDKAAVGVTVVTPSPVSVHPTGVIEVTEWGKVTLSDPIYPNCLYTWADATRNGERVPQNKRVMQGITAIATELMQLKEQGINGGNKFTIVNWYGDQANANAKAEAGLHATGCAVDFWFAGQGLIDLFKKLGTTWEGGVAAHPDIYHGAGFVHLDALKAPEYPQYSDRRRWNY